MTQTYCDICDRDAVGTWQGVCADCWRESLAPGAPNADMARLEEARCWIYGYQHDPLDATPCVHCGAVRPETHFDAAKPCEMCGSTNWSRAAWTGKQCLQCGAIYPELYFDAAQDMTREEG